MTIIVERFKCLKCDHIFGAEIVTNAVISVWTASLQVVDCPQCGAPWNKLAFVSFVNPPQSSIAPGDDGLDKASTPGESGGAT